MTTGTPAAEAAKRPRPKYAGDDDRYSYQIKHVDFAIRETDVVLDVGSGGYPFPPASVLVDRFIEPTRHRDHALQRHGKPLVLGDVEALPFGDKQFDFVYCSHLLEHVDDPIRACCELMRVGRRGYIETPTRGKDILFSWANEMHRWHLVAIASNLCFFEYTPREASGIGSSAWRDVIFGQWHHPIQDAFYDNQDLFNVMFLWRERFNVYVFRLDGRVDAYVDSHRVNAPVSGTAGATTDGGPTS